MVRKVTDPSAGRGWQRKAIVGDHLAQEVFYQCTIPYYLPKVWVDVGTKENQICNRFNLKNGPMILNIIQFA